LHKYGDSLASTVDSVFEESLVNDFHPTSIEEAYEDRLAAL